MLSYQRLLYEQNSTGRLVSSCGLRWKPADICTNEAAPQTTPFAECPLIKNESRTRSVLHRSTWILLGSLLFMNLAAPPECSGRRSNGSVGCARIDRAKLEEGPGDVWQREAGGDFCWYQRRESKFEEAAESMRPAGNGASYDRRASDSHDRAKRLRFLIYPALALVASSVR